MMIVLWITSLIAAFFCGQIAITAIFYVACKRYLSREGRIAIADALDAWRVHRNSGRRLR